jgi:hypothetical protein
MTKEEEKTFGDMLYGALRDNLEAFDRILDHYVKSPEPVEKCLYGLFEALMVMREFEAYAAKQPEGCYEKFPYSDTDYYAGEIEVMYGFDGDRCAEIAEVMSLLEKKQKQ